MLLGSEGWRAFEPQPPPAKDEVEQVIFYATNAINATDEALLSHYRRQLKRGPELGVQAQLWVLLLLSSSGPQALESARNDTRAAPAQALGVPFFAWTERALQQRFPSLAAAFGRSVDRMAREEEQ